MKRYVILLFLVVLSICMFADGFEESDIEYNWGVNVMIDLEGTTELPNGSNDFYVFGEFPSDPLSSCGYAQYGLYFAIWISDVDERDVSSVFYPGDMTYGFEYYGSGFLAFALDNFKNTDRDVTKEYEDGDTLHIRLMYVNGYDMWVYALDEVYSSDDLDEYSALNINASMELCPHEIWNWTFFECFCFWDIEEDLDVAPTDYVIAQNSPNPFNSATEIDYSIPEHANVTLDVYDINARHIKGLVNDNLNRGRYSVKWDGTDESGNTVPSGTYLYKIKAGDYEAERKMLFVK